jgi:DNA-binding MarR family transcriptional regulator
MSLRLRSNGMLAILACVQSTATDTDPRTIARELYATLFALNQRAAHDLSELLATLGLSPTQLKLLHLLARERDDEQTVKALGDQFGLSLPAASRAVEALHQRGYVERRECLADRRMKRVRLTEAGREALRALHASNIARLAEFTATLDEHERRDLSAALAPLLERLEIRPTQQGANP